MSARVTLAMNGSVAVVTLDDGKVNAVNDPMLDDLEAALDEAAGRARAIVLAGRAGVFSGGFDLAVVAPGGPAAESLMRRGIGLAGRLYGSPVPVVAACTGHAVALGAVLLLSTDLRVGADGPFTVGLNEVAIGMPLPPMLLGLARDRLAAARLTEATLLARTWTPAQAVDVGFLDEVVEAGDVVDRAVSHAKDLAGRLQIDAYQETQQALRGHTLHAFTDSPS